MNKILQRYYCAQFCVWSLGLLLNVLVILTTDDVPIMLFNGFVALMCAGAAGFCLYHILIAAAGADDDSFYGSCSKESEGDLDNQSDAGERWLKPR